jgi:hypothetical protein
MLAIASEFLAIDRKERARTPSINVATRPVTDRLCDFNEVVIPLTADEARLEQRAAFIAPNLPLVLMPARPITTFLPLCG